MNELARILFDVDARDTDAPYVAIHKDVQITVFAQRNVKLADLICLGKVRIKIVLAVIFTHTVDRAVQRMAHFYGVIHHLLVQHRQRAGHPHAHRTAQCVHLCAESIFAAAENLGLGAQLGMHLKADHYFIIPVYHLVTAPLPQSRPWQSRKFSQRPAILPR